MVATLALRNFGFGGRGRRHITRQTSLTAFRYLLCGLTLTLPQNNSLQAAAVCGVMLALLLGINFLKMLVSP
jgi:hypothetical protein